MRTARNTAVAAALTMVCAASGVQPARAETIAEFLVVTGTVTGFPGQSLITAAGGPFNNIGFNFFNIGAPVAGGTLFVLTQEYLGTPSDLSAATPGFLAQSTGVSAGFYTFSSAVTLQGNTQYFVYANQSLTLNGAGNPTVDPYTGGQFYTASQSGIPFATIASGFNDADFRLTGTAVAAPEPSAVALLALPLVGMVIRKRRRAIA
jgi:hypothetical protein